MTTFDEEMQAMKKQVTQEVIYHINRDGAVYSEITAIAKLGLSPEQSVAKMEESIRANAAAHEEWFGTVFSPELDNVDWVKVAASI